YLRVTQGGPPGTYGLVVHFSNPQVPPLSLVLDVDEPSPTDVGEDPEVERVAAFRMQAISPSPVVETGMLRVDLARAASLTLTVFDVAGRKVREIASGAPRVAGQHVFVLDARSLRAGVYYVRMQAAALD